MIKVLFRAFTGNYLVPVLVVIAVLFSSQKLATYGVSGACGELRRDKRTRRCHGCGGPVTYGNYRSAPARAAYAGLKAVEQRYRAVLEVLAPPRPVPGDPSCGLPATTSSPSPASAGAGFMIRPCAARCRGATDQVAVIAEDTAFGHRAVLLAGRSEQPN
jgi:hypothetical protein